MAAMVGQAPPSMCRAASIEDEHGDRERRKARGWYETETMRMSLYSEAWQYWDCCCVDKN